MKKNNNPILIFILLLSILSSLIIINVLSFNNETWALLSEGKSIFNNGIYYKDIMSINQNLNVVIGGWLGSVIIYLIYNYLGTIGFLIFIIILNCILSIVLYKLCLLLSKNKIMSLLIMFLVDIILIMRSIYFTTKIFSYIIILLIIYLLELYIKKHNKKDLYLIPILSILCVNLHCNFWFFIPLIIIVYLLGSINLKPLRITKDTLCLFIILFVTLLTSFINPYGIKAATYITYPINDIYMNTFSDNFELYVFDGLYNKIIAGIVLIIGLIYVFFRKGNVKIKYLVLFSISLTLTYYKMYFLPVFIIISIYPLSYFFKDIAPNIKINRKFNYILIILIIISVYSNFYLLTNKNIINYKNCKEAVDIIDNIKIKNNNSIYTIADDGSYLEYRGYKPLTDSRDSINFKLPNNKYDFLEDQKKLVFGEINVNSFFDKYDFDYILIPINHTYIKKITSTIKNYTLVYKEKEGYLLFVNNSLYTEDEINNFKKLYSKKES